MKARDLMTTELHTIGPEANIGEAARLMLEYRVSALPVVRPNNELIGIVSEGDLIRRVEIGTARAPSRWRALLSSEAALAAAYIKSHARLVRDVMILSVVTVSEDAPLIEIADLMERHHIKRLPVTRDEILVGLVSRADLLRALVLRGDAGENMITTDQEIQEKVLAELNRQPWGFIGAASVMVTDGVVHLWGEVLTDIERQAARVAAEGVSGVRGVVDHLNLAVRVPPIA
jgi:CBS domain-containing protein